MDFEFFFINAWLGVGLAMDAFCVSMANGLHEPTMRSSRKWLIAGTFALFQILMPLIGWFCVHTILTLFEGFYRFVPWIALILLLFIGGKMLIEGVRKKPEEEAAAVSLGALMVQGIATSIDALSVGFRFADYEFFEALIASLMIGVVTLAICLLGLWIGRRFGLKFKNKATIAGGVILILIGLEIFISGIL